MNDLISVCMCTYNRPNDIKNTIDSILKQTYTNWEFIIVDDGGIDNTKEVVESYNDDRIRYYYKRHNFIESRNDCLRLAKGKYIKLIDSGDIITPKCLEELYNYCEETNANCVLISNINGNSDKIINLGEMFKKMKLCFNECGYPASLFFKRSILNNFKNNIYYFDEFSCGAEDQQLLKVFQNIFGYKIYSLYSNNIKYIPNNNSETKTEWDILKSLKMVINDDVIKILYNKYNG